MPAPAGPAQGQLFGAPAPTTAAPAPTVGVPFTDYATVTTLPALQEWIARATAAGLVGIETVPDQTDAMRATLVGFALAVAPGKACYVPLAHQNLEQQIAAADAIAALAPLLTDAAVLKVFENAKSDLTLLARLGAPPASPLDDVTLLSYAMDAGAHGHGMYELSVLHLGHSPLSLDAVTGTGRARLPFAQVPLDRATAYAAEDADIALRLWHALQPRLREAKSLAYYEQVDRRLVPILLGMERAGVKVDEADLRAHVRGLRDPHGGDGDRDPRPGRRALQPRQRQAARGNPVRRA